MSGKNISINQIKDLDKLTFYLKNFGELNIEDNNIVLNYSETGNTSTNSVGAGFTIQDGGGDGKDVSFKIRPLNRLFGNNLKIDEYTGNEGYNNLGFVSELNDIVLGNSSNRSMDGFRVIKENDIVNGGSIGGESTFSGSNRTFRYILKSTDYSSVVPTVEDLLPGELAVNIKGGKLYTLKGTHNSYEVVEFIGVPITQEEPEPPSEPESPVIQNLIWTSPEGTSQQYEYPAWGYYDYGQTMFIIRASELGSDPKLIHGLEIEMGGYTTPYTYYNQTIKLAHTSDLEFGDNVKTDLTNINNITNLTTVKGDFDWTINSSGYQTIDFDTNFEYNGNDSLLIIWENKDTDWDSGFGYAICHFDNTYVESWYKHQDNTYPSSSYGTKDLSYRPNFKIKY